MTAIVGLSHGGRAWIGADSAAIGSDFSRTLWTDAARDALKAGGYGTLAATGTEIYGVAVLGYRGRVYGMHTDFQISDPAGQIIAVGGGEKYALGALHAARGSARARILVALEAAARFNAAVAPPFVVLSTL